MTRSTAVRFVLALGLLAVVLPLSACGQSGGVPLAAGGAAKQVLVPSGLIAEPPEIADPVCNGAHGIRLSARGSPLRGGQGLVNTGMGDGSTMFAYNVHRSLVLFSLAGNCTLNSRFAHDGVATIPGVARHAWINVFALAPALGDLVIVAGDYRGRPAVGLVNARGQVVKSFGTDGRVTLPFCYDAEHVAQEQFWPFEIVVAGGYGASRACTSDWIAAISEHGRFIRRFGDGGRTSVPTYGADSGIGSLALERNGDIVVGTGFGNSGCWGYAVRVYSPKGHERTRFTQRWNRFWNGLGWHAFSGDVYADGNGFTLVGTGQGPCAEGPPLFKKKARGLVVHFRSDGSIVGRPARFRAPMFGAVSGFTLGRDTLFVGTPYANASTLHLTAVLPNGSLDPWFGNGGHARVRAPWRGQYAAMDAAVTFDKVGRRAVLIVAGDGGYHQDQAIRIRTPGRALRPQLLPTWASPDSVARFRCRTPGSTVEMESCMERRILKLNRRVNALIRTAWRGFDDAGRRYLAAAQQGWQVYMENECTRNSGAWSEPSSPHSYVGGSEAPLLYGTCEVALTRARIRELTTTPGNPAPH
jgi:uncharacterized protein YecT (DUF1311 family)